eukprot:jgi/Chlat1/1976/Chrsp158S02277
MLVAARDFMLRAPLKEILLLSSALRKPACESTEGVLPAVFMDALEVCCVRGKEALAAVRFRLGAAACRVAFEPNAGGASAISEALSVEYFMRRFSACNVVPEMEVAYYDSNWKKVDYVCEMFGRRVGVSVTRAMAYPSPHLFDAASARHLLNKKLNGLVIARAGISACHSFSLCVLHVWCETRRIANIMHAEYASTARALGVIGDVVVVLTIAEGPLLKCIYYETSEKRKRVLVRASSV